MADDSQSACEEPRGQQPRGGPFAAAAAVIAVINRGLASVFHASTHDGVLMNSFKNGASEIGEALKAFPDSIHVDSGNVSNATGENSNAAHDSHAPSPGMIAKGNTGTVHGPDQAQSPAPSPSDIARGQSGTVHGQQQGSGQAPPSPSDIARSGNDGQVLTQAKPPDMGWADWIEQQRKGNQGDNADNDQNQREKGRSLPDEEREKQKEEDRGRGR